MKKKGYISWMFIKLLSKILDLCDVMEILDLKLSRENHNKINCKVTEDDGTITFIDVTRTVTNHDIYK